MVVFSFRKKLLKGGDGLSKATKLANAHGRAFIGGFTIFINMLLPSRPISLDVHYIHRQYVTQWFDLSRSILLFCLTSIIINEFLLN